MPKSKTRPRKPARSGGPARPVRIPAPDQSAVWDADPVTPPALPDCGVTGWRFEPLVASQGPVRLGNVLGARGAIPPATCHNHDHTAPQPDCSCGYRIVRTVHRLGRYFREHALTHNYIPHIESMGAAGPAFLRVRVDEGPLCPPLPPPLDPPDTLRVPRFRVVGPIVLDYATAHLERVVRSRFGVPVLVVDDLGDWSRAARDF